MGTVEITKELFYTLVNEDSKLHLIISHDSYTDVIYIVEDVKVFKRIQNNYANYYIVDINS